MEDAAPNKRRYIRINSVLPVEFYLINESRKQTTPYFQGFTHNIGKGGLCIDVNDLWWGFGGRINPGTRILLNIELPFRKESGIDYGRIVWKESVRKSGFVQYRIGVELESKSSGFAKSLFWYAAVKRAVPYFVSLFIIGMFVVSFNTWIAKENLRKQNQKLLSSYQQFLDKSEALRRNIEREKGFEEFLKQRQQQIAARSRELEDKLSLWKKKYAVSVKEANEAGNMSGRTQDVIQKLNKEIHFLEAENTQLKQKISQSKGTAKVLKDALQNTNRKILQISPKIIEGMYLWIKNRQDLRTGLVLSYEGDKNLRRVAFSYDEALSAIVFVAFCDNQRARMILDFYAGIIKEGQPIYNAYYTNRGVYEYTVHSGVNAWVGLAALYYTKYTKDLRYMPLAEYIGNFLLKMTDKEGGVIGGPNVKWYSTEHNLDSYAFFKLFYEVSGGKKYLEEADRIKEWLDKYAYTDTSVPVNRGKGDATIATDTYAWSITALGPETLKGLGMDPDGILDFSIKNCEVKVPFHRRNMTIEVEGFDFAKARNIARGGVISCEWTAQMILAFEIMADYYRDKDIAKSQEYFNKAFFYANELEKMIINSPSPAGKKDPTLPYASEANVDTGHGWRTPKGNGAGSLSATAYFLIAYKGINPLGASHLEVSLESGYGRGNLSYTKAD